MRVKNKTEVLSPLSFGEGVGGEVLTGKHLNILVGQQ